MQHELYAKVMYELGFAPEDIQKTVQAFAHVDTLSGLLGKDQEDLAIAAAVTLAQDDPSQENLGRTAEGQEAIELLVKALKDGGHLSK